MRPSLHVVELGNKVFRVTARYCFAEPYVGLKAGWEIDRIDPHPVSDAEWAHIRLELTEHSR